jgi:hypothetical protein
VTSVRRRSAALLAAACASLLPGAARAEGLDASTANSLFRLFTDSGHVTVRSLVGECAVPLRPQTSLSLHWNNERVTIPGISAPPGSKEAVDAITTASRPIAGNPYSEFVKVRNEVQGELTQGHLAATYYISTESDYLAQQLGASANRDLSDQLNLSVGTSVGRDDIQPLANATVQASAATRTTLHWNAVATRVITPSTLLRGGVELNVVSGLQHNPYRNVFAGGVYVPERHPDHRQRRDVFLRLNQYLPDRSSLKLNYRLYNDDWGITSHELGTVLSQYVTHGVAARWEYRYYTQSAASFYRSEYPTVNGVDGYLSGDYRMNSLASHLFGASLRMDLEDLAAGHRLLGRTSLWFDVERYFNSNNYSANILESGLDFHFQ